jgi:hypothetical protein
MNYFCVYIYNQKTFIDNFHKYAKILIFKCNGGRPANKFRKSQIRKFADLYFSKICGPSANVAMCGFVICGPYIFAICEFAICGPSYFLRTLNFRKFAKKMFFLQYKLKMLSFKFKDDFWLLGHCFFSLQFSNVQFADWDTKEIFGFAD